jgi:hypothetical protein
VAAVKAVEKKNESRLTGPVKHGVFIKVKSFARNPPAATRGGFFVSDRLALALRQ